MKKLKRIPLGIINISVSPHDNKGHSYVRLLKLAYEQNLVIGVRGDEYAYLASCVQLNEANPLDGLTGEIRKFTALDEDWENLHLRKAATAEDLKELRIPEHLKPNRETFRYFFFPDSHRFVFQLTGAKRSISHNAVKRLLETIFANSKVKDRFPLVNVVIEPDADSVEKIFSIPHLHRLTVEVLRPNPGEGFTAREAREVEDLLMEQKAASLVMTLKHAPGQSLEPNKEVQKLTRVAKSYGRAVAEGRNEKNRPVKIDTDDHPITVDFDYDKKSKTSFIDQMLAAARDAVKKLLKTDAPASSKDARTR